MRAWVRVFLQQREAVGHPSTAQRSAALRTLHLKPRTSSLSVGDRGSSLPDRDKDVVRSIGLTSTQHHETMATPHPEVDAFFNEARPLRPLTQSFLASH